MPRTLTAGLISDQRGRDGKHMHVMVENKGLSSPSRVAGFEKPTNNYLLNNTALLCTLAIAAVPSQATL